MAFFLPSIDSLPIVRLSIRLPVRWLRASPRGRAIGRALHRHVAELDRLAQSDLKPESYHLIARFAGEPDGQVCRAAEGHGLDAGRRMFLSGLVHGDNPHIVFRLRVDQVADRIAIGLLNGRSK